MANPTVDDSATISPENRGCLSDPRLHGAIFHPSWPRETRYQRGSTVEPANLGMMAICVVSSVKDRIDKGDALCRSFSP